MAGAVENCAEGWRSLSEVRGRGVRRKHGDDRLLAHTDTQDEADQVGRQEFAVVLHCNVLQKPART